MEFVNIKNISPCHVFTLLHLDLPVQRRHPNYFTNLAGAKPRNTFIIRVHHALTLATPITHYLITNSTPPREEEAYKNIQTDGNHHPNHVYYSSSWFIRNNKIPMPSRPIIDTRKVIALMCNVPIEPGHIELFPKRHVKVSIRIYLCTIRSSLVEVLVPPIHHGDISITHDGLAEKVEAVDYVIGCVNLEEVWENCGEWRLSE